MPRPTMTKKLTSKEVGKKYGFRSGLEEKIAADLNSASVAFTFEEHVLVYEVPARMAKYTPDFVLESGVIIETKGRFVSEDRKKMKLIKEQHPNLDIRFLFSNANTRISKKSSTSYGMWCEKFGFKYATKTIPEDWLNEPADLNKIAAIRKFKKCQKP